MERAPTWLREIDIGAIPFRGTLEQIIDFLRRLETHTTFVRVNSFQLTPAPPERDEDGQPMQRLTLILNISTFRFDDRP